MVFCMECGSQIPEGARFCMNCGRPMGAAPAATTTAAAPADAATAPAPAAPASAAATSAPPPAYSASAQPSAPADGAPKAGAAGGGGSNWGAKFSGAMSKAVAAASSTAAAVKANPTVQSFKAAVVTKTKEAGMHLGMKYSSDNFAAAFELPPQQPLLASFNCSILNGDALATGQIYVTPNYLCLYTVIKTEIKVVIPMNTITAITPGVGKKPADAPAYIAEPDRAAGDVYNSLRVFCQNNVVHSFIHIEHYVKSTNMMSVCWNATVPGSSPIALPLAPQEFHATFHLVPEEMELRTVACRVVTGVTGTYTTIHLSVNNLCFKVKDAIAVIPLQSVARIVRCSVTPSRDPAVSVPTLIPSTGSAEDLPKESALQIFTADNTVHQLYSFESYKQATNVLVMLWSYIHRLEPVYI